MAVEFKLTDSSINPVSIWNRRINSLIQTLIEYDGRGNAINKITVSHDFFMLLKKSSLCQFDSHENKIFGYIVNVDYKLKNIDFVVS